MAGFQTLFPTWLYSGRIASPRRLAETCLAIAAEDKAGQRWAKEHNYGGYTSYASLNDLPLRATVFAELEKSIASHVAAFARKAEFDLGGRKLKLDSLWINVMKKDAIHAPHLHPHAVVSGTYYVTVPKGSGAIRFEDPRLAMLMAAPPKKKSARLENRTFVDMTPKARTLLLWESWLRHGVAANAAKTPRISISFNYRLD